MPSVYSDIKIAARFLYVYDPESLRRIQTEVWLPNSLLTASGI